MLFRLLKWQNRQKKPAKNTIISSKLNLTELKKKVDCKYVQQQKIYRIKSTKFLVPQNK